MKTPLNADVRVYLLAYRRPHTISRALRSLLAQTHTNWICELHNDAPDDAYPEQLVAQTNDPRITYVKHTKNFGPVSSFNLAFQPINEPFMSLLEDDNWWEPEFLESALRIFKANPSLTLVWANMWKWKEAVDNSWTKTGAIWPCGSVDEIELFAEDHPRQVINSLHSNGAMLLRITDDTTFAVPSSMPFVIIESVRERAYPLPMALIKKPLGNFAMTLTHCHDPRVEPYLQGIVLLAKSFMQHASKPSEFYLQAWEIAKTTSFYLMIAFFVSVVSQRRFDLLRHFPLRDLIICCGWCGRHPWRLIKMLRAAHDQPELNSFLNHASRQRWFNSNQ